MTQPQTTPDAADATARVRLSVRVDFGGEARIGPGKIKLLETVALTGSISAAGRALGMSYRRAWLLLDALNRTFLEPVILTSAGGAHGGGAQVTPFGLDLVAAYRALEADAEDRAAERLGFLRERLRAGATGAGLDYDE